jgi:hypothetical protein
LIPLTQGAWFANLHSLFLVWLGKFWRNLRRIFFLFYR